LLIISFNHLINKYITFGLMFGRVIVQAVSSWLTTAGPEFEPRSGHVRFVDKIALVQVFFEYFGFPCHSLYQLLHTCYPIF
jgi:hypothetical protein